MSMTIQPIVTLWVTGALSVMVILPVVGWGTAEAM